MLKSIDKALAGAIDIVADQMQATVKNVREDGVSKTFGDIMESTGETVAGYAHTALDHIGVQKGSTGPPGASVPRTQGDGVVSAYADLCTGSSKSQGAGAGATAPHTSTNSRDFGSGVGIQRAGQSEAAHAPQTETPAGKDPQLPQERVKSWFDQMRKEDAGNSKCFDCGGMSTEWASVSFGCLLCLQCAGKHRGLGTHISRIRSISMDSWTQRQLDIFKHGGNARLRQFFEANDLQGMSPPQSMYLTPGAEWYREAWIKNMTFDRPVPAPPADVVAGPCVAGLELGTSTSQDASAAAAQKVAPAPPVDLLDFGGGSSAQSGGGMDLIGFDSEPIPVRAECVAPSKPAPTPASDVDLLGFGSAPQSQVAPAAPARNGNASNTGGDLLGLDSIPSQAPAAASSNSLLLTGLDFSTASPSPASTSAPSAATPAFASSMHMMTPGAAATPAFPSGMAFSPMAAMSAPNVGGSMNAGGWPAGAAMAPAQRPVGSPGGMGVGYQPTSPSGSSFQQSSQVNGGYGGTLAGGARLAAPPKKEDKADDPFALALSKWNM